MPCLSKLNNHYNIGGKAYQARNIDGRLVVFGRLLETTSHGEVFISWVESILGVSLWDGLYEG